jgi:hypothetical protein
MNAAFVVVKEFLLQIGIVAKKIPSSSELTRHGRFVFFEEHKTKILVDQIVYYSVS